MRFILNMQAPLIFSKNYSVLERHNSPKVFTILGDNRMEKTWYLQMARIFILRGNLYYVTIVKWKSFLEM